MNAISFSPWSVDGIVDCLRQIGAMRIRVGTMLRVQLIDNSGESKVRTRGIFIALLARTWMHCLPTDDRFCTSPSSPTIQRRSTGSKLTFDVRV